MHRRALLDLLSRYEAQRQMSPGERGSFDRIVAFVRAHPDCFERSLLKGHITGSAWVMSHDEERCVLTHHKKLGIWVQPGGHADGESDVWQVAFREATEESGIPDLESVGLDIFDVDVHRIPANSKVPEHDHYDVRFLFRSPPEAKLIVSEESHDLRWVDQTALADFPVDDSVRRMAKKWQQRAEG